MFIHRKLSKCILLAFVCIGISGCQTLEKYSGEGRHLLAHPTLGNSLESQFAKVSKVKASRITVRAAPRNGDLFWAPRIEKRLSGGSSPRIRSKHQATYLFSKNMDQDVNRILSMYYEIDSAADVNIEAIVRIKHEASISRGLIGDQFWNTETVSSLQIKEVKKGGIVLENTFVGQDDDFFFLTPRFIFPTKSEADEMVENAYRDMWTKFLQAKPDS